jgi:hypothetical protein
VNCIRCIIIGNYARIYVIVTLVCLGQGGTSVEVAFPSEEGHHCFQTEKGAG